MYSNLESHKLRWAPPCYLWNQSSNGLQIMTHAAGHVQRYQKDSRAYRGLIGGFAPGPQSPLTTGGYMGCPGRRLLTTTRNKNLQLCYGASEANKSIVGPPAHQSQKVWGPSGAGAQSIKQELAKLNKFVFNKNFICCRESRIESANSFYASFYVGPFEESFSLTLAHNLRRTLLSELTGLAILAVEIDGVVHRFSSMPGVKETTIDILSNLQNIVFKKTHLSTRGPASDNTADFYPSAEVGPQQTGFYGNYSTNQSWAGDPRTMITNQVAYLRTRGPGVVKAADIILPHGIECVNPDKHIATLAEDGMLNMRLIITEGKNAIKQKVGSNNDEYNWGLNASPLDKDSEPTLTSSETRGRSAPQLVNLKGHRSDPDGAERPQTTSYDSYDSAPISTGALTSKMLFLDSVFMPVTKVNSFVETNPKATDIGLEKSGEYIYTNSNTITNILSGSASPRSSLRSNKSEKSFFNIINTPPIEPSIFFQLIPNTAVGETATAAEMHEGTNGMAEEVSRLSQSIDLNYVPESTILVNQPKNQCHIVLEIWTNGSIHPRQALEQSLNLLTSTFLTLTNVKQLGSMYKSDLTYKTILKQPSRAEGPA